MAKLNLTEEQKEMLRKGYRRAQQLPEGFNMGNWVAPSIDAPCGTVCCFAGEIILTNTDTTPQQLRSIPDVEHFAYDVLGIPYTGEFDLLDCLFLSSDWPRSYRLKLYAAQTPKEQADILAELVERFIEADGDTSAW